MGPEGEITRLLTQDPRAAQVVKYGGVVYLTGQVWEGRDITLLGYLYRVKAREDRERDNLGLQVPITDIGHTLRIV